MSKNQDTEWFYESETFSFFWLEFDAVVKLRSRSATRCLDALSLPDSSSISASKP